MMKSNRDLTNEVIERIVELSADAHIGRRRAAKGSPAFHSLSGAIAAYGKALALLVALQQREGIYARIGQPDLPKSITALIG